MTRETLMILESSVSNVESNQFGESTFFLQESTSSAKTWPGVLLKTKTYLRPIIPIIPTNKTFQTWPCKPQKASPGFSRAAGTTAAAFAAPFPALETYYVMRLKRGCSARQSKTPSDHHSFCCFSHSPMSFFSVVIYSWALCLVLREL